MNCSKVRFWVFWKCSSWVLGWTKFEQGFSSFFGIFLVIFDDAGSTLKNHQKWNDLAKYDEKPCSTSAQPITLIDYWLQKPGFSDPIGPSLFYSNIFNTRLVQYRLLNIFSMQILWRHKYIVLSRWYLNLGQHFGRKWGKTLNGCHCCGPQLLGFVYIIVEVD